MPDGYERVLQEFQDTGFLELWIRNPSPEVLISFQRISPRREDLQAPCCSPPDGVSAENRLLVSFRDSTRGTTPASKGSVPLFNIPKSMPGATDLMFKILNQAFATGIVTTDYPARPMEPIPNLRGRPVIDFERAEDCLPAAVVCPTGALTVEDKLDNRKVTLDYGRCIFCGLCAEASADSTIRLTGEIELAVQQRSHLVSTANYRLDAAGKQHFLKMAHAVRQPSEAEEKAKERFQREDPPRAESFAANSRSGCRLL